MLDAARRWVRPLELLYTSAPVALVILAPLTDQAEGDLRGTVDRTARRLRELSSGDRFADMVTLLFVCMGFRHDAVTAEGIMEELGLKSIIEGSELYGRIRDRAMAHAHAEAIRATILRQGWRRFGRPEPKSARQALESVNDPILLEALMLRVLDVSSWEELLAG
jgi:hypothetical protein